MWTHSGAPEGAGRIVLGGGLIGLLVLIENYRVLADAALMRDEYPPFRLDTDGTDPASGHAFLEPPLERPAAA